MRATAHLDTTTTIDRWCVKYSWRTRERRTRYLLIIDPFGEWVKPSTHPCFQRWGERLVEELGASWDTFRRDRDDVVKYFQAGGIPILAAHDMVQVASEVVQRCAAPMAIFWDLENMPIPTTSSGRDVTIRLKSNLTPHGDMVQFRGYASIGLGLILQQKRILTTLWLSPGGLSTQRSQ